MLFGLNQYHILINIITKLYQVLTVVNISIKKCPAAWNSEYHHRYCKILSEGAFVLGDVNFSKEKACRAKTANHNQVRIRQVCLALKDGVAQASKAPCRFRP